MHTGGANFRTTLVEISSPFPVTPAGVEKEKKTILVKNIDCKINTAQNKRCKVLWPSASYTGLFIVRKEKKSSH